MKQFDNKNFYSDNINWIDENNVVLGWDMGACCCEQFGYFFSLKELDKVPEDVNNQLDEFDAEGYNFVKDYFKNLDGEREYAEAGGVAQFKLVNGQGEELYLCLYNFHNGYYGHGFTFEIKDGEVLRSEGL